MKSLSLVAGALALGLIADTAGAVVLNGSFEDTSSNPTGLVNGRPLASLAGGPGTSWDVFTAIPGWTTVAGSGIEVQTNRTLSSIDAHSGRHYVELDSHPAPNSNSTMAQTIALDRGEWRLDFYYSPRTSDVNTNGIAYSVLNAATDELIAGAVTGPSATQGTKVGLWTLVSALFTVKTGDSPITLRFAATGSANTLGGFLDDISLTQVSAVPLPAALPMLLAGLGGLAFAARRRRAA